MAKKITKDNNKPTSKSSYESGKLISIDLSEFNIKDSWISLINFSLDFEIVINILFLVELFFAQLVDTNKLAPDKAMQSEMHKTGMTIINSAQVRNFISAVVTSITIQYSMKFKNQDIAERYRILNGITGARNSRFKGVTPSINMSEDALVKYGIGYQFHLKGKLSTHSIYYPYLLKDLHGIDLSNVSLSSIRLNAPYPEYFDEAVKFIREKIQSKNPHTINETFEVTLFQKEIGLIVESSVTSKPLDLFNEEDAESEEELQRIRLINEQIKKSHLPSQREGKSWSRSLKF